MPMPVEYHGNHESTNFGLATTAGVVASQDANNMTANMYRVGDYVYFETSSTSPYQIRRIEELNKTPSGNVEAKVMCFFRRRDLPSTLIMLADKHQLASVEQQRSESPASTMKIENQDMSSKDMTSKDGIVTKVMSKGAGKGGWLKAPLSEAHEPHGMDESVVGAGGIGDLSTKQRHQMKHRELFLSRQVETMPATHIRGKCCVTLLNETESLLSYLNKEDSFFYCLVFDPAQRTLLADKGEIRVGSKYQADGISLTSLSQTERDNDSRKLSELETLVWTPRHSLTDRQIDQFLVVSRSVGTFARALDCSSSIKQPSLHMSAAAASRDITLFHAMDTLHKHNYDVAKAMSSLVPLTGPVLCRDEMEEWSASEANLFEEALDKYGKDFSDIRQDFLPWKTLKNVIEYYYMWKTTDRYVQQKRVKAVEAESKLKQVYIPNYNKTPSTTLTNTPTIGATIMPIIGNNSNTTTNGNKNISILNGSTSSNSSNGNIITTTSSSSTNDTSGMLIVGGNVNGKPCESCLNSQSTQWYSWGPSHMSCRLCQICWTYWKKYGGLKSPSRIDDNDLERKNNKTVINSDDEIKNISGAHRPHRCNITTCGKEFKLKAHLSRHYASVHGVDYRGNSSGGINNCGSGSPRPVMKTRSAFYLRTSVLARAARRLCSIQLRIRHFARSPHQQINSTPLRQLCLSPQLTNKTIVELKLISRAKKLRQRPRVTDIATKLGDHPQPKTPGEWDWLALTSPGQRKQPDRLFFPRPPKAPDGSLLYERIPNKPEVEKIPSTPPQPQLLNQSASQPQQTLLKRPRPFDEINGSDGIALNAGLAGGPPAKRILHSQQLQSKQHGMDNMPIAPMSTPLNGRSVHSHNYPHGAPISRSNARKQVISWMDAPDDVYFRATEQTKRLRRALSSVELRRSARKPWRRLPLPITSQMPQPPPPPPRPSSSSSSSLPIQLPLPSQQQRTSAPSSRGGDDPRMVVILD
ncbi:metastasis-associated protein MTA3 isoform X2 [Aphidius gifuensis]|uniref:metastasis-associated protein MTA3 isoform X2 n=1 Tax=Aphidius gifuensis TaxID=684658 RepID=UPI001CDC5923|nr:metastasis-associated protein MTA3 isoform X2 [Aphidius gifuensis]